MKQTIFIVFITLIFLVGCEQRTEQVNNNKILTDTLIRKETNNIDTTIVKMQKVDTIKTVSKIIEFIDSLYVLNGHNSIDTITDWVVTYDKYELGPKVLDLTYLEKYYRYLSFEFLLFKNKMCAKKQFERIIDASNDKTRTSPDDGNLYWNLFSKAGSSYILYENIIIYHHRRCNYDERIETPREDKIINYLFDNTSPNFTHFIRVKCGWKNAEIK